MRWKNIRKNMLSLSLLTYKKGKPLLYDKNMLQQGDHRQELPAFRMSLQCMLIHSTGVGAVDAGGSHEEYGQEKHLNPSTKN